MKNPKIGKLQSAILEHLREALEDFADVSVAFLISGMSTRLLHENLRELQKATLDRRVRRSIELLEKRGLIELKIKSGEPFVRLPKASPELHLKLDAGSITLHPLPQWDSVWRMVIFDVPEKQGKARRALSYHIAQIGALRLQDSVFVYPFPWRDEIEAIGQLFRILPHIRYIEATSIDGEEKLKKYFNLT